MLSFEVSWMEIIYLARTHEHAHHRSFLSTYTICRIGGARKTFLGFSLYDLLFRFGMFIRGIIRVIDMNYSKKC